MRTPRPAGTFLLLFFCSINNTRPQFVDLIFCDVTIPRFLAAQEPEIVFLETCLACSGSVYRCAPLVGVTRKIWAASTKFSQTLKAAPLGGAVGSPIAGTIEYEEDIDGSPPWGVLSVVRQQPPSKVKKTSMAGPLGCYR
jgi:hypothetical protein